MNGLRWGNSTAFHIDMTVAQCEEALDSPKRRYLVEQLRLLPPISWEARQPHLLICDESTGCMKVHGRIDIARACSSWNGLDSLLTLRCLRTTRSKSSLVSPTISPRPAMLGCSPNPHGSGSLHTGTPYCRQLQRLGRIQVANLFSSVSSNCSQLTGKDGSG